jgi:hypothetical protein
MGIPSFFSGYRRDRDFLAIPSGRPDGAVIQ